MFEGIFPQKIDSTITLIKIKGFVFKAVLIVKFYITNNKYNSESIYLFDPLQNQELHLTMLGKI